MIFGSLAEIFSISLALPFLTLLVSPESIFTNPLLAPYLAHFSLKNTSILLPLITLVFGLAALLSGIIRIFSLWANAKVAAIIGIDIGTQSYKNTLNKSYEQQLQINSSNLVSILTLDLQRVISYTFNPTLTMISSIIVGIGIISVMLIVDLKIAVLSGLFVLTIYSLSLYLNKDALRILDQRQSYLFEQVIRNFQESFSLRREILIDGNQDYFYSRYTASDTPLRNAQAESNFRSSLPRLILEPSALILISIVGYLLVKNNSATTAIPILGLLAISAQRLLPIAQKIFEGWALTKNSKTSFAKVMELLADVPSTKPSNSIHVNSKSWTTLTLDSIFYQYQPSNSYALHDLSLKIPQGQRLGIVGPTGSGKSTLTDLLMGLLTPTSGLFLLDNVDLLSPHNNTNLLAWRSSISHVPQSIYLLNASIRENIAIGVPVDQINNERLYYAAEKANLLSYISSLPNKFNTNVGERGSSLSGGQIQRIGIARAFYKQSSIIIFDEATSSLDADTECQVINEVFKLDRNYTLIFIAHRTSTLLNCDHIVRIVNGRIVQQGSPHALLN